MSLHASPPPETIAMLRKQRRNASLMSFLISLMVLALVGVILALFVFAPLVRENPVVVAYDAPPSPEQQEDNPKTKITQSKPQPPSSASSSKVITSSVAAPVALPTVDVDFNEPTLDFGAGDDFGEGLFDSGGTGAGVGGGSSGFGSQTKISGALVGSLYDFKQNRRGRPSGETDPKGYGEIVERIQRRGFSESAFSRYFKAPNELSLTNLAIPRSNAAEGPKYFGAEEHMEPKMWLAHYSGEIVALEPGTYRFVGMADDYVSVFIDGDPKLIARRPDMGEDVLGRWKPAEESGKWAPPTMGVPLDVGDWVEFKRGERKRIDLAIGERPGGFLYFILMVQKQGETYRKAGDGRPILPLFTTALFSDKNREEISKRFGKYEFEWEKVPVFPAQ